MAEKIKEPSIVLEREYIVPLRSKWLKTPKYKRVPKAIKALREFVAKHMKIESRDLDKVKLDKYLNHEMWFRGIRKPASKIKIKAKKFDSGVVRVELAEIPAFLKFKIDREKKIGEIALKEKPAEVKEEKKEEKTEEEKKVEEEKKEAEVESGLKMQDMQAKEMKHAKKTFKEKPKIQRKALQK